MSCSIPPFALKHPFNAFIANSAMALTCGLAALNAADSSTVSLADQEIQRRLGVMGNQTQRLAEAENLLRSGQAGAAYTLYQDIFQSVPNLPLAQELRHAALEGYTVSGCARAGELMRSAQYEEASKILDTLDRPGLAEGHPELKRLRKWLNDPDRFPPALTPSHIEKVKEVGRLLTLAGSQSETGMFDKALSTYEQVLLLDPTNSAARRGMENVERERARYFESAKDHRRSQMLNGINQLWEQQPATSSQDISSLFGGQPRASAEGTTKTGKESIAAKLREIKLEKIDFSAAALEEVLEYLRVRSRDLDPSGKGVDFVMSVPKEQVTRSVSLSLNNVPIEEVLRYVVETAGVGYRVEEYAVRIVSLTDTNQTLISKNYRVPPDFISTAAIDPSANAPADPFAAQNPGPSASGGIARRLGAREFLESRGVTFPEGASANYNPVVNVLIVRNTAKNLELVDSLVEQSLSVSPKMAVVEVKIVEINQTKLDEMGFDWLLEGFGSNVEFSGGTVGNAKNSTFVVNEFPENASLNLDQSGPVTAGLRSSADVSNGRSIEDVLFGAVQNTSTRSPGVLSLAGVLTNPQFQVVWRALDQKTGVDMLSRPSVIVKSGQKASVEMVREFIYPTEYDPPQIPTNIGNTNPNLIVDPLAGSTIPAVPVTPTTPTAFETRRVGVVLDVEPVISDDGRAVDITLTPEFTEFVGFVNYGSPIFSVQTLASGLGSSKTELTPNTITQPIFSTKKITTGVKVYDGSTVVLGGLITDQSIIIDDKVPVMGDLPVVGRLFQSKVKQRRAKNIIMFVTVKVVDPSGNRVNPQ